MALFSTPGLIKTSPVSGLCSDCSCCSEFPLFFLWCILVGIQGLQCLPMENTVLQRLRGVGYWIGSQGTLSLEEVLNEIIPNGYSPYIERNTNALLSVTTSYSLYTFKKERCPIVYFPCWDTLLLMAVLIFLVNIYFWWTWMVIFSMFSDFQGPPAHMWWRLHLCAAGKQQRAFFRPASSFLVFKRAAMPH